jgi:galactokinase
MDNQRVQQVCAGFAARFGQAAECVSRSPGRIEILGNHTDYNAGTVLSVAVDRAMFIAAARIPGDECQLFDLKSKSARSFSLRGLWPPAERDWSNYIKGLVYEMQQMGIEVPAFQAVLHGEVPLSAGMSSSAALEMAMMAVLRQLSGRQERLDWLTCARLGQACENKYVGANTGLLDQFSSLRGRAGQLVYSDFRDFSVKNIPMPVGTAFVVANSLVKHNLTNEYNERRQDCEAAVAALSQALPGVKALRDVTPAMLEEHKSLLDERVYRRALHVVGEIDRVERGVAALEQGDLRGFGALLTESHYSSRDNFENSCPELDALVECGSSLPGFLGARLSGGGFGGITVHLVEEVLAAAYQEKFQAAYAEKTGRRTETMICHADNGTELRVL